MDELIRALIKKLTDAGLTAVRAFPEGMMPRLTKAVTAVGIREVKSAGAGAYAYLGMREDEAGTLRAVYGRRLEAEAFLQVWCPRVIGGKTCMDTAEQAMALSAMDRRVLELTLPVMTEAMPGDSVSVTLERMGVTGRFIVAEKQAALTGQGLRCTLSLRTW